MNTMSIYDKDNHLDQLSYWWDIAEEGVPKAGDTVIFDERHKGLGFHVTKATMFHPHGYANARILSRAPNPKPTWHDAVAVVASAELFPDERRVMVKCGETIIGRGPKVIYWEDSSSGAEWRSEDPRDVTPLIEAKVTEEMVEKALDYMRDQTGQTHTHNAIQGTLRAALGIEESNV